MTKPVNKEDERGIGAAPADLAHFSDNMLKLAGQGAELARELASKQNMPQLDPFHVSGAVLHAIGSLAATPEKLARRQMELYGDLSKLWISTSRKFLGEKVEPVITPDEKDKRFKDPNWDSNAVFDYIKQSYLLYAGWLKGVVSEVQGLSPEEARKLDFYTRQFIDAVSPSNFLFSNPEALKTTFETGGDNLVRGMRNLLGDMERGSISQTALAAFEVGKNLAVTQGRVVFRNDLIELIQYEPATEKVHKTPLLVIPAWINKYYIADLKPENSLVKWLVEQGYTVFIISWANPDERHSGKTFEDYMLEGPMAAMGAIEKATGEKEITALGYCLGGTLLATMLSWMAEKKDLRVKSATFLTTMLDFSEAGELGVFIDEEQIQAMEKRMSEKGYLDGTQMAATFSMLRSNDLIWSFYVNNYLMGKDPFPFDLLYWNADSTRMPARMHSFYLRKMYQENLLAKPGGVEIAGVKVDLGKINIPVYFLSAREDHIAPWKSTYRATQLLGRKKGGENIKFVLTASGHIAGVVNPPEKKKYCYWTNSSLTPDSAKWLAGAKETPGSWWPDWDEWNSGHSGGMVKARKPAKGLCAAPGEYVKVKTI